MKRIFTYLSVLAVAAACSPRLEIEFPHEQQAFETRADRILVEAILPQATAATDEVYIIGAFNGNDAAIGNDAYKLTRSETITAKWGVYLDPSSFQAGKTLADGFTFYNVQQGYERSSRNQEVSHTLSISTGNWANVYADKWEKYFQPVDPDEGKVILPEHNGTYRVYVKNTVGWDAINLYMYGDVNNLGGDWPGIAAGGQETFAGITYTYFDFSIDEAMGKTEHLIFNDGNGTQIAGAAEPVITYGDEVDLFFDLVSTDEVNVLPNPASGGGIVLPEHDGTYRVYAKNTVGWSAVLLYMYGDVNNLGGDWPGIAAGGEETIDGVTYTYFDFSIDEAMGKTEHLIFNDGNGTQIAGAAEPVITYGDEVDIFFEIVSTDEVNALPNPAGGGTPTPPAPPAPVYDGPKIYIQDNTTWGGNLFAHYWIDGANTEWPGQQFEETETVEGVEFKVISTLDKMKGKKIGIIFHSDVDDETNRVQTEITLDTDRYYVLTNEGLTEVEMGVRIIVKDESGWPGTIFAHIWDDDDNATEWPGIKATGGYFDSDSYLVFLTPKVFKGKTVNVIFHSDDDADNNRFQTVITLDEDRFYVLSKEFKFNEQEKKPVTIYVEDKTGWDEMALYLWGEVNNLGGEWPGNQLAGTEEIMGVSYKIFVIPDAFGRKEVLIFNNNGHDVQLANYPDDNGMLFDQEEYFFVVTAEGVTASERPTKDPNARATRVYVNNETGWTDLYLYVWGDRELFGSWAGAQPNGKVTFAGVPYSYFDIAEDDWGKTANFIFNNNAGTQLENFDDLKGQTINKDFFFHLTADAASQVATPSSRIYVQDNTGWANLYVYSWGTGELFGGWPGKAITETTTIGDVTYKYVDVPADKSGWAANLIFNNNDGTQLENFDVLKGQKIGCDFYFKLTADNVTVVE